MLAEGKINTLLNKVLLKCLYEFPEWWWFWHGWSGFFGGKSGEKKLLPEVMVQLMREVELGKKMASTSGRGFFLSLCKILSQLSQGNPLQVTPQEPLESTHLLTLSKHSKPASGNAQDESDKTLHHVRGDQVNHSHFIIFLCKFISWPSLLCISPSSHFNAPVPLFDGFDTLLI